MTTPVLKVTDLAISFTQYDRGLGRRTVRPVAGMSLTARAGEVTALVGASGAGKSLFGHALLGLLPPNASETGRVEYDGSVVEQRDRRRLAGRDWVLLPQSVSHLDPTASVGSQVRRALRLTTGTGGRREVAAALARHELDPGVARLYPHQLSGGMARRVLMTMALSGSPRLLFADEPTPGLQPELVASTLDQLRGIADAGTAVVLVTHDLVGALRISDRVVVVHEGRTLDEADPAVFAGDGAELAHPYTRSLWRALPVNGFLASQPAPELEPAR